MSLVVFRSKAAGEIFMFAETTRRILEIIGRPDASRGVITAEQDDRRGKEGAAAEAPITLGQRTFPLIEMLRAAQKRQVDVTWGV